MTISGSKVYKEIKGKISEVERKSKDLEGKIDRYEHSISLLTDEREGIYGKLSLIYLPELNPQAMNETLKEVEDNVRRIFKEKQEERRRLENYMRNAQEEREKSHEEFERVTEQLGQKAKKRDEIEEQVAGELNKNQEYTLLHKKAQEAEKRLVQNKERVQEVKEQAENKLPDYGNNRLFMYLVNRGFGTGRYNKTGIVARLDSWVAKKINFKEAKECYDFLVSMPELMQNEVNKRQEELDNLVKKLQGIEKSESDKYGLTQVIEEGTEIGKQREQLANRISSLDANYQNANGKRKELDSTKGEYHQKAIRELKAFLKGENIQLLKDRARGTPGSEDDNLAVRIEEIDESVREFKDKSKEAKKERDSLAEKLRGLKKIENDFTRNDYESHRSYFDSDLDINGLLTGYIIGKHSSDSINNTIGSNQHFKPKPSYHSSGSYSSSHSSGSGFGGGFGGGGFSGGGGFGGGGFSSGKGF